MWTNERLATATVQVNAIENAARVEADGGEEAERAAALAVTRQAGSLRRALEQWIVARATNGAKESLGG